MNTARYTHTATLLANGKVLVATGIDTTAQLYDPVAKTFSNTGSLNVVRQNPSATLLPNGTVLIAGGLSRRCGIASAELYDPATGNFSFTRRLECRARSSYRDATDGRNRLNRRRFQRERYPSDILASAEIYNPSTSTFTLTGSLTGMRWQHTATLLNDGSVLIAGGFGSGLLAIADRYFSTAPLSPIAFTTPRHSSRSAGHIGFPTSSAFHGAQQHHSRQLQRNPPWRQYRI